MTCYRIVLKLKNISHKEIHIKSLQAVLKENKEKLQKVKKQLLLVFVILTIFFFVLLIILNLNLTTILVSSVVFLYILLKFKAIYDLTKLNKKIKNKITELNL